MKLFMVLLSEVTISVFSFLKKHFLWLKEEIEIPTLIFIAIILAQVLIIKKNYFLLAGCLIFGVIAFRNSWKKRNCQACFVLILIFIEIWISKAIAIENFKNAVISETERRGEVEILGQKQEPLVAFDRGRYSFDIRGRIYSEMGLVAVRVILPESTFWIPEIDSCDGVLKCKFFEDGFQKDFTFFDSVRTFTQGVDGIFRIKMPNDLSGCACENSTTNLVVQSGVVTVLVEKILAILENSKDEYSNQGLVVLLGAVLGVGQYLPQWIIDLFRETGLYHLLVVSGYHLGVIFLMSKFLLSWALKFRSELLNCCPKRLIELVVSTPFVLIFVFMSDSLLPLWRALIAFILGAIMILSGRKITSPRLFLVTLIVMNLIWPLCITMPGVQMTFAALAGVTFGSFLGGVLERRGKNVNIVNPGSRRLVIKAASFILPNFFAIMAIAPFQIYWFGGFSISSLFFNLLFAWPFSVLVVGGGIFSLPLIYLSVPFSVHLVLFHARVVGWFVESLFAINSWVIEVF